MRITALFLLLMTGCTHRSHSAKPDFYVPQKCILGGAGNRAKCSPISKDRMVCDGVVIPFACIEVHQ